MSSRCESRRSLPWRRREASSDAARQSPAFAGRDRRALALLGLALRASRERAISERSAHALTGARAQRGERRRLDVLGRKPSEPRLHAGRGAALDGPVHERGLDRHLSGTRFCPGLPHPVPAARDWSPARPGSSTERRGRAAVRHLERQLPVADLGPGISTQQCLLARLFVPALLFESGGRAQSLVLVFGRDLATE